VGRSAMSNILAKTKQQQIEGLGRLGWYLRKIEAATGVSREPISGYLAADGIPVRRRGGLVADWPPPNPATTAKVSTDSGPSDPVIATDPVPGRAPTASACEPYRELIVEALGRGRNAMAILQDLVDGHGFTGRSASVRSFVSAQRAFAPPEPSGIITTGPGEEGQVD
jgi:hypothetical protein